MTERLADVSRRIGSVGQLASVIGAMRAMAGARAREARQRLEGVRAYSRDVGAAIGRALAIADGDYVAPPAERGAGALAILVFGAEQGFAGPFNSRILDAAGRLGECASPRAAELMAFGSRAILAARQREMAIAWSRPMVGHLDQAAELAERIVDRLFERLASGEVTRVAALYAAPAPSGEVEIVERVLAPFDFRRFARARPTAEPLITQPPAMLLARLADEYLFAEIVEAVILSFAAENEARLTAMTNARTHISDLLERLTARARTLRQEEITNEIIELAADAGAMESR